MLNYLFRRLNLLLITGFFITVIAFAVTYWSNYSATDGSNYIFAYFQYLYSIISGDWGISSLDQQPILMKGWLAFASTLELCLVAFAIAFVIAIPLGILAALNRNRFIDYVVMSTVLISLALPVFWVAAILTMGLNLLGISVTIAPALSSAFSATQSSSGVLVVDALLSAESCYVGIFCNHLMHLLLSAGVLSIFLISEVTRLTRHSISDILKCNYIKAAYTKGLSNRHIIIHHVLKNALPPIIHQIRLQLSTIISFAMVVEIVFSMPGTGSWLLNSINAGDYLALPTAVLLISGFILLTSTFVDILLVVISPVKRKALYVN